MGGATGTQKVVNGAVDGEAGRLMRRATYASVTVALLLVAVKLGAWMVTDSVSLLSTLVDSLLDAAASIIMLVAVRESLMPPDSEHRFGHGKAEPLAALGQSAFITGSALFLVFEATQRLFDPKAVPDPEIGFAVMGVSIVATFLLTRYQAYVVRRSGSLAISADSLHYLSDLLVNAAVVVALLLSEYLGWIYADPIFALGIAAYIMKTAWSIGRGAFDMLMDRELPDAERQRIKDMVMEEPKARGLHDLRTRASGPQVFIQLHLELDGDLSFAEAHAIADRLEMRLAQSFNGAEVLIHEDLYDPARPPKRRYRTT